MADSIWQTIRETLSREIAEGRFPHGGRLPTEAELSARFAVNRHTVRRAIGVMRDEGLVHSRRGSGVFVTSRPIDYRLGSRTRFTQQLQSEGQESLRRLLRLEMVAATERDAAYLQVPVGSDLVIQETLGIAADAPVTHGEGLFPAERLPGIMKALEEAAGSATAALAICGVGDYRRAWTRITAERASAPMARHLEVADGAPLIRTRSLNVDLAGRPVELGRTFFCADRIELVVENDPPV